MKTARVLSVTAAATMVVLALQGGAGSVHAADPVSKTFEAWHSDCGTTANHTVTTSVADLFGRAITDSVSDTELARYTGGLDLTGKVTDGNICIVRKLTGLTMLNMSNNISLVDPWVVKNMTNLTTLDLGNTGIVDISNLNGLSKLESLNLQGMNINDLAPNGINVLASMTSLKTLNLKNTLLGAAGQRPYIDGAINRGAIITMPDGALLGDVNKIGIKGDQGEKGDTGPQGPKGDTGANGQDGTDGQNGINGTNGRNGLNGTDGAVGPQGEKGEKGETGKIGAQGTQGEKGSDGSIIPGIISGIISGGIPGIAALVVATRKRKN